MTDIPEEIPNGAFFFRLTNTTTACKRLILSGAPLQPWNSAVSPMQSSRASRASEGARPRVASVNARVSVLLGESLFLDVTTQPSLPLLLSNMSLLFSFLFYRRLVNRKIRRRYSLTGTMTAPK